MTKPISKSKRQLAQLLIEAGVTKFPEGANWAAQDKCESMPGTKPFNVIFYTAKPKVPNKGSGFWFYHVRYDQIVGKPVQLSTLIPNWHQTVLSRDEFDQIVAETVVLDADGWIEWEGGERPVERGTLVDVKLRGGNVELGQQFIFSDSWSHHGGALDIIAYRLHKPEQAEPQYCESVMRSIPEPTTTPTLDQLLQDWRNADDYAQRKQTEADEAAALRDERWQAVQARAGEMGVTVGRCESVVGEPTVTITDWRDLQVGDEVEAVVPNGGAVTAGARGIITELDHDGFWSNFPSQKQYWYYGTMFERGDVKFIRRP